MQSDTSEFTPPVQITAGESGSPLVSTQGFYQDLSRLVPAGLNDQPLLIPFDINNLAIGTAVTFICDAGIPDYWLVTIRPLVGVRVSVFRGPNSSGIPFRLGGGGKLRVPANSEYLTVVNEATSVAAFGTATAIRKYKDFDLDAGDVA